jgi:hypothetical protein
MIRPADQIRNFSIHLDLDLGLPDRGVDVVAMLLKVEKLDMHKAPVGETNVLCFANLKIDGPMKNTIRRNFPGGRPFKSQQTGERDGE